MNQHTERSASDAVALTGDQVRFVRTIMRESQAQFARRFAVSSGTIYRIEAKGNQLCRGPEIILIQMLADQHGLQIPESFPWAERPENADVQAGSVEA